MCQTSPTHPSTTRYWEMPGCISSIPWAVIPMLSFLPAKLAKHPLLTGQGLHPYCLGGLPSPPTSLAVSFLYWGPKLGGSTQVASGRALSRGDSHCPPPALGPCTAHTPPGFTVLFFATQAMPHSCSLPHQPQPASLQGIFTYIYIYTHLINVFIYKNYKHFLSFCRTFAREKLVCWLSM